MEILHIAAHLGGGAGKAIVGMAGHNIKGCKMTIILSDYPEKSLQLEVALQKNIEILVKPDKQKATECIRKADIIVLNWWDHPLMNKFLFDFPDIPCRIIIWSHINGCTYPYLPFKFLNRFVDVLFTTPYSYDNPIWNRGEKHEIWQKSEVVYGMGEFQPITIMPKIDYEDREKFVIGYIGTLNYGKLNSSFVDYCEAAAKCIPDIYFVLVGEINEDVMRDIRNSSIFNKFEFVGHTDEVEKYYINFDVFGYLLNEDNYATTENSLLEAMAFGLPIIVMDNDVESRIIKDGYNGYIVKNEQEYADELLYLRKNSMERKAIGQKAREYVLQHYSEEKNFNTFYGRCIQNLSKPKNKVSFKEIIGNTPCEWFLYFANRDGIIFSKFLADKNETNRTAIRNCKKIFKETSKSSITHFRRYFPNDDDLKCIEENV